MKNIISKIKKIKKKTLEAITIRLDEAEEQTSELEDKVETPT